jgi:DNA-binding response OmpR family regulator
MFSDEPERATIVVCEDDEATLDLLCDHLTADKFEVLPAPSAADALRLCRYNNPDLMLLDLALPDGSGFDVLRTIREADGIDDRFDPKLPIIVLTGRADPGDRVRAIDMGADDYLQKPFLYEEVMSRITPIIRRRHNRHEEPVRVGELVIDPGRRSVKVGDRPVRLSKKEFTLLRALASDPTRVFSKDELLRDVWGFTGPPKSTRTLDSHASRLRRKLDPEHHRYVVNCWGIGYRLIDDYR